MPTSPTPPVKSTPAQPRPNPRKRLEADRLGVRIAAGIMAGVGWVLLYQLVVSSPPLAFPRWLFLILLYIAVTGTALPLISYLNRRFSRSVPITGGILLRQGMWFGLFAVTAAWLQMTRALTLISGFLLALSLLAIEVFIRIRERGQSMADRVERASRHEQQQTKQ